MVAQSGFSNLQLELLKIYSTQLDEKELEEVERVLAEHFAKKTIEAADRIFEERGYSEAVMDQWLEEKPNRS